MGDTNPDKRGSSRKRLILAARCRRYDGMIENVMLTDLSETGCRLYLDDVTLRIGQRLTLQPRGLEGIAGQVRWVAGQRAGIAFDEPLHCAVAEHLQRRFSIPTTPGQTAIRVLVASI